MLIHNPNSGTDGNSRLATWLTRRFPDGLYLSFLRNTLDRAYRLSPGTLWNNAVKSRLATGHTPRWAPELYQLGFLVLALALVPTASSRLAAWVKWPLVALFGIRLLDAFVFALHWIFVARDPVHAYRRSLAAFLVNVFEIPLYYGLILLFTSCVAGGGAGWDLLYQNVRDLVSVSLPTAAAPALSCQLIAHAALLQESALLLLALTVVVGMISRGEMRNDHLEEYTVADWAADMAALYLARTSPPPCPRCARRGFHGPRHDGQTRMYRLCKFCGFSQTVGANPIDLRPTVHGCTGWRHFAGAPYLWWVRPDEPTYECEHCHATVDVSRHLVARPVDDPEHPWWQVRQDMSFDESVAFWQAEGRPGVHL